MLFKKEAKLFDSELIQEGGEGVLYVNYLRAGFVPSIASQPEVMARTVDVLQETTNITRVVLVQQRNYSYSFEIIKNLKEIGDFYNVLINQEKVLSPERYFFTMDPSELYNSLNYIFGVLLKQDPVQAYRVLKDFSVQKKTQLEEGEDKESYLKFLSNLLERFEGLEVIKKFKIFGGRGREVYDKIFPVDVMPNFTFTRVL